MDFSNNFELLHFQFDRWLYKTVTGMFHLFFLTILPVTNRRCYVYFVYTFHYTYLILFSIFHIFSGAVESAKKHRCSPRQALDTKAFSAGHWEWCHRFLIDANKQDGYPTLFFTFSPYEWNFPLVRCVFLSI